MTRANRRSGYTLFEMVVVLVVLIVLAAAVAPTIPAFYGNTRQKAAVDIIRTRLAEARAKAIEDGQPYQVSVNQDRTRIRLAPDGWGPADHPADSGSNFLAKVIEDALDQATVEIVADPTTSIPAADQTGWITVGTFLPDGTCREVGTMLAVRESDYSPIMIHVRGVTGGTRISTGSGEARP